MFLRPTAIGPKYVIFGPKITYLGAFIGSIATEPINAVKVDAVFV